MAGALTRSAPEAAREPAPATREALPDASPAPRPIPAGATPLEILVVDEASGQPAAGAQVAWFDESVRLPADLDWEERIVLERDTELLARRFGWRTATDTRGIARLHRGAWTRIHARAGNHHGSLQIRKEAPEPPDGWRVELVPDVVLKVLVLDARGRPADGVPIEVTTCGADGTFLGTPSGLGSPATYSGPDGIARIPHLQESPPMESVWRVRAWLPGSVEEGIPFVLGAVPADPIVLRLPPCGRVAVRVETEEGSGMAIGATIRGMQAPPGRQRHHLEWWPHRDPDGWWRLRWVPAGVALEAFAAFGSTLVLHGFDGPRIEGEEVQVVVPSPAGMMHLAGRILDPDGKPRRVSTVGASLSWTGGGMGGGLGTDAEGRFVHHLGAARGQDRLDHLRVYDYGASGAPLRASTGPRDLRPGRNDLGDLRLAPLPRLASGRFVIGDRPYTARVQVRVDGRVRRAWGEEWEPLRDVQLRQDGVGGFVLHSDAATGGYRLVVVDPELLPMPPVEFTAGDGNVIVRVRPASRLVATLRLPDGAPDEAALLAALAPERADAHAREPEPRHADGRTVLLAEAARREGARHAMMWTSVPDGTYTLRIHVPGLADSVREVPGVAVPAPEGGDPRLRDIDLRAALEVLSVRASVPSMESVLFLLPQDHAKEWWGLRLGPGVRRVLVPRGPRDLMVAAPNHVPLEIRGARGSVEAKLEPWPEIELRFPGLMPLPEAFELKAVLGNADPPLGRSYRLDSARVQPLDPLYQPEPRSWPVQAGRVAVPISERRHRLHLWLNRKGASDHTNQLLESVVPAVVARTGGPVEVHVPEASLRAALGQLGAGK